MFRSRTIRIIALAFAVAALLTIGFLSRLELSNTDSVPPEKQTFEARIQATEVAGRLTANAFLAMGTTGPKHPEWKAATSCPVKPPIMGIWPYVYTPISGAQIRNYANARASTGDYYSIFAGAPDYYFSTGETQDPDEPHEGLLVITHVDLDPCASIAAGKTHGSSMQYKTPHGPLMITKIDGDTVIFSIANGGMGRFNYLKGEFLP